MTAGGMPRPAARAYVSSAPPRLREAPGPGPPAGGRARDPRWRGGPFPAVPEQGAEPRFPASGGLLAPAARRNRAFGLGGTRGHPETSEKTTCIAGRYGIPSVLRSPPQPRSTIHSGYGSTTNRLMHHKQRHPPVRHDDSRSLVAPGHRAAHR